MWCERVIRNLTDLSAADREGRFVDWVDIEWNECGRVLKKQTRRGQPVRVLLPPGERLGHNDVIFEDAARAVAIHVRPCEVIVATAPDASALAVLALELGNLHVPVQVGAAELVFVEDGPAMAVLDAMQISWTKQVRRFEPVNLVSGPSVNLAPSLRVIVRSQQGVGEER
jgi:urease accessory protein UreE